MAKAIAYLRCKDVVHRQNVHFGIDGEWSLDLRTDEFGTIDLCKLVDLVNRGGDTLEGHITSSAVGAEVHVGFVDGEQAVFDVRSDEDIGLTVPERATQPSALGPEDSQGRTHIVSGLNVAATI